MGTFVHFRESNFMDHRNRLIIIRLDWWFFHEPSSQIPQAQNTKKKQLTVKIWRKKIRSKYEAPKYLQMKQVLDGEFPASSHLLLAKVFKMPGIMVVLTISKPIVLAEFQLKGWVSLFLLDVRQIQATRKTKILRMLQIKNWYDSLCNLIQKIPTTSKDTPVLLCPNNTW